MGNSVVQPGQRAHLDSELEDDVPTFLRLLLIGDEASGKTSLLLQFTEQRYLPTHQFTVGVDSGYKMVEIMGQAVKLQLWDTAGDDQFRAIVRSYYPQAAGALLVYDITNRASFLHLRERLQELRQATEQELFLLIVGNKCDREEERRVLPEEGHELALQHGCHFLETSAVTGHNVDTAFQLVADGVFHRLHGVGPSLPAGSTWVPSRPQSRWYGMERVMVEEDTDGVPDGQLEAPRTPSEPSVGILEELRALRQENEALKGLITEAALARADELRGVRESLQVLRAEVAEQRLREEQRWALLMKTLESRASPGHLQRGAMS